MRVPHLNFRILIRCLFALSAAALSLYTSQAIYQGVPTGADENSYIFQAYNFSEGKIARPAPVLKEAFRQEMIILDDHAGWLSRYPPAHSLWLVPGIWMGNMYLMIALAAALGMWFVCLAASEVELPEWLAALPLLICPFFGFMYGTLLSHTSGFATVACMLWAYLRWRQKGGWKFAVLAGLAWAFFFLNRTYTAMLIAIPFGVDAVLLGLMERTLKRWIGVLAFAAAAFTGVVSYLGYNELVTGSAFNATYLYYEPSENLGFGPRRTQGMTIHHSLENGIKNLTFDIYQLNRWMLGFTGSLVAWVFLIAAGWRHRFSWLLSTSSLAVWIGYIYFWFPGVKDAGGPVYFFETIPMLILLGGFGLQRIWNASSGWPAQRAVAFGVLFLALASVSVAFSMREAPSRIKKQTIKRNMTDVILSAPPHSMVMIEDIKKPHIGEMVINPRGEDSDPLVMKSLYKGNMTAMRVYSNRTPFLLHGKQADRLQPVEQLTRIELGRNARNLHKKTGRDAQADPSDKDSVLRLAEETQDQPGELAYGRTIPLPGGTFDFVLHGTYAGIDPSSPTRVEVHSSAAGGIVVVAELSGTASTNRHHIRFVVTNRVTLAEPRIHFGGSGTVMVSRVAFEEVR